MIRFCDKEVYCVFQDSLDRDLILKYFLNGHMDDIICIMDEAGGFKGKITYYSLINSQNIYKSIMKEYVILDENIWNNAKDFFKNYKTAYGEHVLLPVLDKFMHLLCFAYDTSFNCELRMLKELTELGDKSLQFSDIYPEYKNVIIYGFNELAYYFKNYLEKQNISVQVQGEFWNDFVDEIQTNKSNCGSLSIYAEGLNGAITDKYMNNDIYGEFECIYNIYEANIKKGLVSNTTFDYLTLIDKLKQETEIVVIGTGLEAQDVYDFFLKNDINVCCFLSGSYEECQHKLFGKNIEYFRCIRQKYQNPVFIECTSINSAWGFGGTDNYDYMGYRRNKSFFLIRDYLEIPEHGLESVLKAEKIALIGNYNLCSTLYKILINRKMNVIGFINIFQILDQSINRIPMISIKELEKDTICLIVLPEYFDEKSVSKSDERKKELVKYLKKNGLYNYTDYFSYMISWICLYNNEKNIYLREWLKPKRIVLGAISGSCGNYLFRGLLNDHPSIIMMDYSWLNNNLFWICVQLAEENIDNIVARFWELYKNMDNEYHNVERNSIISPLLFSEKLDELFLKAKKAGSIYFSSQELFVIFHIAYMNMYERNITNINDTVIYWEPHFVYRYLVKKCEKWLGEENCEIIDIHRNSCARLGSNIKIIQSQTDNKYGMMDGIYLLNHVFIKKVKDEVDFGRNTINIKFEDLKCYPNKILRDICDRWDIEWSDVLMHTTRHGEEIAYNNLTKYVKDFDLGPVYNLYEEYFSELDRIRLMIYYSIEQKMYYPYEKISQFSMKELDNLFQKNFRFEYLIRFHGVNDERDFRLKLRNRVREKLLEIRVSQILDNSDCFIMRGNNLIIE